mgnify:CR=1 FL=1
MGELEWQARSQRTMEHKLTVTVPEEVYQPLVEEALKQGRTPEEEASLRLQRSLPTTRPKRNGDIRKFFGMYKGGIRMGLTTKRLMPTLPGSMPTIMKTKTDANSPRPHCPLLTAHRSLRSRSSLITHHFVLSFPVCRLNIAPFIPSFSSFVR